ncbi:MAG: hypothetical protein EXR98_18075 [Gemmataceae bacterium]|nr:hypothetical protein [Gemmataceae bacterium]
MLKRRLIVAAALAAMLGFFNVPSAWAKPADLPSHNPLECLECGHEPMPGKLKIELSITPKGISLNFGLYAARPDATPALDAVLPAFVEHWLQHMGDVLARPDRSLGAILGRLPIVGRLTGSESRLRDAAEESGGEDPQTLFHDMRNRSIELGLIELAY